MARSVHAGGGAAAAWFCGPLLAKAAEDLFHEFTPDEPFENGVRLGRVEFDDRKRSDAPRERPYGRGLDGRLRTDLSRLEPGKLIIPNDRFYIRTRCPRRLDTRKPWTIRIGGLVRETVTLGIADLERQVKPMGVHLMECAGSGTGELISAATWSGAPVSKVLERIRIRPNATRVLIGGFDDHPGYDHRRKELGASWVFTLDQLEKAGAFLATGMNGKPLPRDHGRPVRLFVPGWYGCAGAKWVNRIEFVDDDQPSTAQMREFAGRTHQDGTPRRARDYKPATIGLSAMPTRVEKWRVEGRIVYRVLGILWGGDRRTDDLKIRFGRRGEYVPVESCDHRTNRTWTLWTHTWRPRRAGRYRIRLRVDDPTIPTHRLDVGWYDRTVRIADV